MRSKSLSQILIVLLLLCGVAPGQKQSHSKSVTSKRSSPIFVFHTEEFWLNLHHFLYVLGRAQNQTPDSSRLAVASAPADQEQGLAKLKEAQQKIWREAVTAYAAGPSKKDLVFDDPLPAVTTALAEAGDKPTLEGSAVDENVVKLLQAAAPIYRKIWWKSHQRANRAWQQSIQKLVDLHGAKILAFITKAYQLDWPAGGFDVHLSGYANWAGAYSTDGNLLVVSSLSSDLKAEYGLETVFHEGMHQWDSQIQEALREQAKKLQKRVPRDLSHALIFFTAGEAVRSVVPGHVPYAEKFGVWGRGLAPLKTAIEEIWKPYLEGQGTRDEALAELVKRVGR
ncbi:MAG TPA: hypothetical protein VLL54_14530 [Pyrinomonadaceae bacterium]|nr:hypothetical protein [Pyrinomonadaceae bacterium]